MKKRVLTILILLLWAGLAVAQVLQAAKPESVKMSSERLQHIDRTVQAYIDSSYIPGAVALIVRDGKVAYHKAFGYADVEARKPLERDAIFRIASQTKAVTSIAVMMLYEEGRFLLDDPVSKYIPAFAKPQVLQQYNAQDTTYSTLPAKREITIRDLLTHTSGIGYAGIGTPEAKAIYAKHDIPSGIGTPNGDLGAAINRLAALPLMHQPGERFTYGLNTDVLGYFVEVVSGMSLDAFFHKRIFEPLGMKDTYFYLPAAKHARLTRLYTENSNKKILAFPNIGGLDPDFHKLAGTFYSGGAGLASTAYDYAIFLQMLLNGGEYNGRRLLSPAAVRMITTNQIGDLQVGVRKFGLGFAIATEEEAARIPYSVGTFDWGGAFATTYWADPQERIIGVIMTQKYPNSYGDLNNKFKVLVYQAVTGALKPK
ncbi:MAG: beta-lactamase family protein [Saprospiraceae bacterium]|nr:beta-lactamase family protein [Saprospiraceae bacterium]